VGLAGENVSILPFTIARVSVESSARQVLVHELRRSRAIGGLAPLGHLGSVLIHALALALLAAMLSGAAACLATRARGDRREAGAEATVGPRVASGASRPVAAATMDIVSFALFVARAPRPKTE
jgi:ceramide glucosyltransferase